MQISTKSLSALVLVLLAAACGSTSDPDSMPAANGGGVFQGTVMGGGSQNMRVAVPSSKSWRWRRPRCSRATTSS